LRGACWAARFAPAARSGSPGLPEAGKGPSFAAAVGLLVYPQVAHVEHFEPRAGASFFAHATDGYFSRVGRWLRESF
jgi:cell division protein FtsA